MTVNGDARAAADLDRTAGARLRLPLANSRQYEQVTPSPWQVMSCASIAAATKDRFSRALRLRVSRDRFGAALGFVGRCDRHLELLAAFRTRALRYIIVEAFNVFVQAHHVVFVDC